MRLGRLNSRHSKVTDWGLSHASIGKQDIILDIGCGGGRTLSKLAAIATQGKIYGIDHSTERVAMAMRMNKQWIDIARVEAREASVSRLPFSDGAFYIVTAIETHFWWPALPTDLREVLRVLKPGGRPIIIAEVYKGAESFNSKAAARYSERAGMALLSVEEHRELFTEAGYSNVRVITEPKKGWICSVGSKPPVSLGLGDNLISSLKHRRMREVSICGRCFRTGKATIRSQRGTDNEVQAWKDRL